MTIDLLKLARQVQDTYTDVECSFGIVRVYHVPDPLIWTYRLDKTEPIQPTVSMKLATGDFQERPIKSGDAGYDEWVAEFAAYDREQSELRFAARYVESLKDVEYPEDLSTPPPMAEHRYNGSWPENEVLRKKIWLDYTILAIPVDTAKIMTAIMEMGGLETPKNEDVENVKKNSVSGSKSPRKRKPKQT